ncbi:hypothetical protein NKH81_34665 [Mesorhizobium sp. M0959]|uniref:hypothetical protein n=1 Tax=Mesorhizobium sp. M0959 TaxID=2957034 RepID=UPI00333E0F2B
MNHDFVQAMARPFQVHFGLMSLIPKHHLQPPEPTMRQERTVQASIFDLFATQEIGHELRAMSCDWTAL